jgi:hypothetical protein
MSDIEMLRQLDRARNEEAAFGWPSSCAARQEWRNVPRQDTRTRLKPHIVLAYDTNDFSKGVEVRCPRGGLRLFDGVQSVLEQASNKLTEIVILAFKAIDQVALTIKH